MDRKENRILSDLLINLENDMNKLEEIYDITKLDVYKFALSILKNASDAEDVMQDTYINIYKYAHMYKSLNKPMAWILTITRNLALNKLKKSKKDNIEIEDNHITCDNVYDIVLINHIFESLNEEDRKIVMLKTINNLRFIDISKLLDLNLSTVLSKYNRAIKKIKNEYKDVI